MNKTYTRAENKIQQTIGWSGQKVVSRLSSRVVKVFNSAGFRFAVAVFLLSLFVRVVYLCQSSNNPTFRAPILDSMAYDQLARGLAQGRPVTYRFFWQQFFYPSFLAVVYFFSNSSIVCARLVQVFLGCITCVLTYRLGERTFGRVAGFLAGCMIAVYGPLIFFESELLAAGWASFWAAVLILLFIRLQERKSLGLSLVLGLCGALSVIARPNFIPFLAAGGVWLAVVWIRERIGVKKLAVRLVAVAVGFCVVAGIVAVGNYRVTNRFSFLPADGALNIYIGNNPDFEAVSIRPGMKWKKIVNLPLEQGLYTADEQEHFFYIKTLEYIRTQPTSFLKGILRKSMEFISSREMPGNIDIYLFTRWSRLFGLLTWKVGGFGFPFGMLLPLALLGLVLCWRSVPAPVILFCVFYPASVVLTHIEARYRMPIIVPMCVLAGLALARIIEMLRMRRWSHVVMVGVFGTCAAFICSAAGPFYAEQPGQINYEAELYYGLGDSLDSRGQVEDATEAYFKALSLRDDYIEVYNNLGLMLVDQGKIQEAVAHYNTALKLDPENAYLHSNLGKAIESQGKPDEAIKRYRLAIQLEPHNIGAHVNLGIALQLQGKLDEAARHYRQALRINPDLLAPLTGMVWILLSRPDPKLSDVNQAIEFAEHAAELTGYNDAFILNTLAVVYAAAGRFDHAVTTAETALKLAVAAQNDRMANHIRKQLELYRQAKP